MDINIRPALMEDVDAVKDRLRYEDSQEVIATGAGIEDELRESVKRSTLCFCVDIDGNQAALFGVVPQTLLSARARVWLLGTDDLAKVRKTFVKMSRVYVARFLRLYPVLWNCVDVRYKKAINWLMAIGADFSSETIGGPLHKFYLFEIRRV